MSRTDLLAAVIQEAVGRGGNCTILVPDESQKRFAEEAVARMALLSFAGLTFEVDTSLGEPELKSDVQG
jgi:hypothetical protein